MKKKRQNTTFCSRASFHALQQNPGELQPKGLTLSFFFFFELTILIYGSIQE